MHISRRVAVGLALMFAGTSLFVGSAWLMVLLESGRSYLDVHDVTILKAKPIDAAHVVKMATLVLLALLGAVLVLAAAWRLWSGRRPHA